MHADDLALVEHPTLEKVMENFHFSSPVYKLIGVFISSTVKKITQKVLDDFEPFKPDIFVDDGSGLSEYGFDARIIHIPGHTPGSIGILTADGDLISGDTFTNIRKPDMAPNAADFDLLKQSIGKLAAMKIRTVYPGHGEPFPMNRYLKGKKIPSGKEPI